MISRISDILLTDHILASFFLLQYTSRLLSQAWAGLCICNMLVLHGKYLSYTRENQSNATPFFVQICRMYSLRLLYIHGYSSIFSHWNNIAVCRNFNFSTFMFFCFTYCKFVDSFVLLLVLSKVKVAWTTALQ